MAVQITVNPGDNLWNLSKKYLGDGNQYQQIIKTNNLTSNSIYPGQTLIIPRTVSTNQITVRNGDSLSILANKFGTSVQELSKLNNITDPYKIFVGQQLLIPKTTKYKPQIRNYQDIKKIEASINKKSNLDIINTYHKNKYDNQYYLVDDKQNNKLSVYLNGNLVKSYKAIHGKIDSLEETIRVRNKEARILFATIVALILSNIILFFI